MTKATNVAVTVTPLEGSAKKKKCRVPAEGMTVGDIATKMGLDLTKKNIMVDGKPATANTVCQAKADIQISERPKGS